MGFFGNKKPVKEDSRGADKSKSATPDYSSAMQQDLKFPEFATYDQTTSSDLDFESIKQDVSSPPKAEDFMPKEEVQIPQRKKMTSAAETQQAIPDMPKEAPASSFSSSGYQDSPYSSAPQSYSAPAEKSESTFSRSGVSSSKPLFVKIEDYKDAIYTIDKIKAKLKEADVVLEEISKVRKQEDTQLEDWKHDIDNIKSRLLEIDKQLFGE